MRRLAIGLLMFTSCTVSKQMINTKDISIVLTKMQCGSYEVKNNASSIGYAVKPFVIEVEKQGDEIIKFENLIKKKYTNYYNSFYRIYTFTKDRSNDTILVVIMLSTKQVSSIPNWQCEEQDVDTYTRNRRNLFNMEHPQFISYNCTKDRFKSLGDSE